MYDGWETGKRFKIWWCFAKKSGSFVMLSTTKLAGLFRNVSIIPEAVIHACVSFYRSSGPIRTIPFSSASTNTVPSNLSRILVYVAMHLRGGYLLLWTLHLVTYPCFFLACPLCREFVRLGIIEYYPPFGCKVPFRNLSMYESPKRTGNARLHTTPRATLTRESPILAGNIIFYTVLTLRLVAIFNEVVYSPI